MRIGLQWYWIKRHLKINFFQILEDSCICFHNAACFAYVYFLYFQGKFVFKRITNAYYFFSFLAGVSLAVDTPQHAKSYRGTTLSHAARTHAFKKLRAPSQCRECESYVYFQGAECQQVRAWFLVIHAATSKTLRFPVKNLLGKSASQAAKFKIQVGK